VNQRYQQVYVELAALAIIERLSGTGSTGPFQINDEPGKI
jgi:hypothetical protein